MYVIFYSLSSVSDLIILSWCNLVCLCFLKYGEVLSYVFLMYVCITNGTNHLTFFIFAINGAIITYKKTHISNILFIHRLFFIFVLHVNALPKTFYSSSFAVFHQRMTQQNIFPYSFVVMMINIVYE